MKKPTKPLDSTKVKDTEGRKTLLRVEWDPKNTQDCALAEDIFRDQRRAKRALYAVKGDWKPTEQINKFDKKLGRMLVLPSQTIWDKINKEVIT